MSKRTVVWFRNDLRTKDNPILSLASSLVKSGGDLICLYCFDPRHFQLSQYNSMKTGIYRASFLIESVSNLRKNLRTLGTDLLVSQEKAECVIPKLFSNEIYGTVLVQGEDTYEEICMEKQVESALASFPACKLERIKGGYSLYHPDDLPFRRGFTDMGDTFTTFKDRVEKSCRVRSLLPKLNSGDLGKVPVSPHLFESENSGFNYLPSISSLGFDEKDLQAITQKEPRAVMDFRGGEDAALERIENWIFRDDKLKDYFEIRNGMLGEAYSSKLSPWLAAGCVSPRWIFHEVKRYEMERRISNKSTYWLIFELIWRDFFRCLCAKYKNKIFYSGGIIGKKISWRNDEETVFRWKNGLTGLPLVDANMRELLHSGWMSNRGRQNVASYLVHDLKIDWRIGADHFESYLLDHDVCSNYGNWNAAAGLTGGRINKFNISKQSRDYDPNGDYIRHWVPELASVPAPFLFEPWKLSLEYQQRYNVIIGKDYPFPVTQNVDRDEDEHYRNFPKKKDRFNVSKYYAQAETTVTPPQPTSRPAEPSSVSVNDSTGSLPVHSVFPKLTGRVQKF